MQMYKHAISNLSDIVKLCQR